jgi:hypothetical protein
MSLQRIWKKRDAASHWCAISLLMHLLLPLRARALSNFWTNLLAQHAGRLGLAADDCSLAATSMSIGIRLAMTMSHRPAAMDA